MGLCISVFLKIVLKGHSKLPVISRLSSQLEYELFFRTYVVGANFAVVLLTALANHTTVWSETSVREVRAKREVMRKRNV